MHLFLQSTFAAPDVLICRVCTGGGLHRELLPSGPCGKVQTQRRPERTEGTIRDRAHVDKTLIMKRQALREHSFQTHNQTQSTAEHITVPHLA